MLNYYFIISLSVRNCRKSLSKVDNYFLFLDNDFLQIVERERGFEIKLKGFFIFENVIIICKMPRITRSISKIFEREKVKESERDEMLEAAYILLTLSKGN